VFQEEEQAILEAEANSEVQATSVYQMVHDLVAFQKFVSIFAIFRMCRSIAERLIVHVCGRSVESTC
jgi:hypothetical protein